jgi:sodium/proline symporter
MDQTDWAVLAAYATVLLAIGAAFVRRQGSSESFLLGDRTLGTATVFASTFSTFYGTGIVFTFASFGYLYGVGAFGLPGAAVVGFLPLAMAAPRIKALSDRRESITLPGLLAGSWSYRTRALAALLTGGLFAAALAVNLHVAGRALEILLGVPLRIGIVGFGIVVIASTVLGGFRAVVWTDVLQLLLVVASVLVILPAAVFVEVGPGVIEAIPDEHLDPLALPVPIFVVYLFVGVFTFFGSQDIFQRIYAARGGGEARRGLLLFTASLAVVGPMAVALGIGGRAILSTAGADSVLFVLTNNLVPSWALVVLVMGFLALANSDADSQLLTVASTLTQDLLPYLDVGPGELQRMSADRLAVVGVGMVAVSIAATISDIVPLLGGLGTLFTVLGVVVIATLYWDETTDRAVFAGLGIGVLSAATVILVTGSVQIAPVVGLVMTAATVVLLSLQNGRTLFESPIGR